jgi:xylan 1,4-beta-xylosidase
MKWSEDGWLRTEDESGLPAVVVKAPELAEQLRDAHDDSPAAARGPDFTAVREDFDAPELPIDFQWLRSPWPEELFSLTARPGYLRLYGRESVGSQFRQALIARRQQAHCYSAATAIDFEPENYQQMAGLICYYNGSKFHYLYLSHDATEGKHLRVMSVLPDQAQTDAFTDPIRIPADRPVHLRVEVDFERLYFAYRLEGDEWRRLAEQFDASILSDEASQAGLPNFTGAFVGMCCQDMAGTCRPADFDYFEYREREFCANPFGDESS